MSASSRMPTGIGEVGNAKCGDIMKIYLKIDDDKISDVKFETFGCGSRHRLELHGNGAHQGQAPVSGP